MALLAPLAITRGERIVPRGAVGKPREVADGGGASGSGARGTSAATGRGGDASVATGAHRSHQRATVGPRRHGEVRAESIARDAPSGAVPGQWRAGGIDRARATAVVADLQREPLATDPRLISRLARARRGGSRSTPASCAIQYRWSHSTTDNVTRLHRQVQVHHQVAERTRARRQRVTSRDREAGRAVPPAAARQVRARRRSSGFDQACDAPDVAREPVALRRSARSPASGSSAPRRSLPPDAVVELVMTTLRVAAHRGERMRLGIAWVTSRTDHAPQPPKPSRRCAPATCGIR